MQTLAQLYTRDDIQVGRHFTVTKGLRMCYDEEGNQVEDKSYQTDCLEVLAVDYPLVVYQDVCYRHNKGIISLKDFEIRFLNEEFVNTVKRLYER